MFHRREAHPRPKIIGGFDRSTAVLIRGLRVRDCRLNGNTWQPAPSWHPGRSSTSPRTSTPPACVIVTSERTNTMPRFSTPKRVLMDLQDKFLASADRALLIILQAIDAAGKDSTIKHVMSGLNPPEGGVHVYNFTAPFCTRARSRLPLAPPASPSGIRSDRGIQPISLRECAHHAGASGDSMAAIGSAARR